MRELRYASENFDEGLAAFCETAKVPPPIVEAVSGILAAVREQGDVAIVDTLQRVDGIELGAGELRIEASALEEAQGRLDPKDLEAIQEAIASVIEFHRHALPKGWSAENRHGATIGEQFYPLERVGLYIPTGLVSTVVMTASLARLAGVPEIVAFTPCAKDGGVSDGVLAAMSLCGVTEAYRIGGPSAIAAGAFGTETIRPVVKVFGPGNAYTVEAKRQVYGTIGVDLLPGPSELLVIVDASANPRYVAADLLAQAEHGSGREKVFLVSLGQEPGQAIREEMQGQLENLPRRKMISEVLENGFLHVVVDSLDEAEEVANYVAPEHLELEVEPTKFTRLSDRIKTAGAIMEGEWTATALGDFVAGPSHELPTGRSGRFSSGLQVGDFFRRSSKVSYTKAALDKAAETAMALARMEGLAAHERSVSIRLEESR